MRQDGVAFAAHPQCKEQRITATLGSLERIGMIWNVKKYEKDACRNTVGVGNSDVFRRQAPVA